MSSKYVQKEDIKVQKEIKADLPEFDVIDDSRPLVGPAYSGEQYESRFPRIYEMMLYEKLGYNEMRDLGAKEFGITLIGFSRGKKATIYTNLH